MRSGSRPKVREVAVLPTRLFASTISSSASGFDKVCENCGTTFTAQRITASTCSPRCRRAKYETAHAGE